MSDGEDFEGGYDDGGDTSVEDSSSRLDVEDAVIRQKQDRGDPDPHRSDRGYLRGQEVTKKVQIPCPSDFELRCRNSRGAIPRRRARAEETFKARAQPFGIARFNRQARLIAAA